MKRILSAINFYLFLHYALSINPFALKELTEKENGKISYEFSVNNGHVSYESKLDRPSYSYRLETFDDKQSKHEEGHFETDPSTGEESLVAVGGYEFIGDNGQQHIVTYTADKNGYRPTVIFGTKLGEAGLRGPTEGSGKPSPVYPSAPLGPYRPPSNIPSISGSEGSGTPSPVYPSPPLGPYRPPSNIPSISGSEGSGKPSPLYPGAPVGLYRPPSNIPSISGSEGSGKPSPVYPGAPLGPYRPPSNIPSISGSTGTPGAPGTPGTQAHPGRPGQYYPSMPPNQIDPAVVCSLIGSGCLIPPKMPVG